MASLDNHVVHPLEKSGTNLSDQNRSMADVAASAYSPTAFASINNQNWDKEVREAVRSFTSQELPNFPVNNKDCGPTSIVTVLKNDGGFSDHGDGAAQEAATRLRITGADNPLQGTSVKQLFVAAESYGLTAQNISGIKELNTALAQGKQVIVGGAPTFVSNGVNFEGNNLNNDASARHFVTVFGFNAKTGNYLVDNSAKAPGSGPQEKSVAQMKAFIADTGLHGGIALTPPDHASRLSHGGIRLGISEIKSAPSISESHHSSAADRLRRAADIDIRVPLLTFSF